jgi:hypothetical protein
LCRKFKSGNTKKKSVEAPLTESKEEPSNLNFALAADQLAYYKRQLAIASKLLADSPMSAHTNIRTLQYKISKAKPVLRKQYTDHMLLLARVDELKHSIESLSNASTFSKDVYTEADAIKLGSDGTVDSKVVTENVTDVVGGDHNLSTAGESSNIQTGQSNLLELSDFFQRPIEIARVQLNNDADIDLTYQVWDLWSKTPSIRAKLRNYAYFRGNLHLRIAVSGTPFDYGRLLLSYQPWANYNTPLSTLINMGTSGRFGFLNYLSQAPGSTLINVNENIPVEMTCPFISFKPMHRVFNTSSAAIGAATPLVDFYDAGSLYVSTLNQIASTSASPTKTYMQIYAWMEDVELGVPTATQLVITTECDSVPLRVIYYESDERVVGPVERFSSSVVNVSNILAKVPFLAPFATASSMIASAVGSIAALFGWSKPVMIREVIPVKNKPFSNGAVTIGTDTASRIVLDPKQELTVDPRVVGIDYDDMVIATMAARRSYITTFQWATTAAPMEPIYSFRVNPSMVTSWTHTTRFNMPSAMAFAVAPFSFWRGDICFRLEVVCSAFHRGKFLVAFEPNISQFTLITSTLSLNKQFLKIVDIQETQVIDFKINWAAYRSWYRVSEARYAYYNTDPTLTGDAVEQTGYSNGFVVIAPFTELQSPDSQPVEVNLYAWCENLQVNGLTQLNMPNERDIYTEAESSISSVPVSMLTLNPTPATTQNIALEHFGEQPLSFRALLKRFVTVAIASPEPSSSPILDVQNRVIPYNNMTLGTTVFQFRDLLSYLRQAYLGLRGGSRYRIHTALGVSVAPYAFARAGFLDPGEADAGVMFAGYYDADVVPSYAIVSGYDSYVPFTNGGIEAEFPLYTNNSFLFSFYQDQLTYPGADDVTENLFFRSVDFRFEVSGHSETDVSPVICDYGAAEDFTLLRFQGAIPYSQP